MHSKYVAAVGAAVLFVLPATARADSHRVCGDPQPLHASCLAEVVTTAPGSAQARALAAPSGYGAADLQSAYGLSATGGAGRTIAIVDAYDDPTAEADLGVYRSTYGLPACTTANGCFRKVNQNGAASPLPATDGGWAQEISLDLDMASASCPGVPHPARRGERHVVRQPRRRGQHGRLAGRERDLELLRRGGVPPGDAGRVCELLQPPGHRDHRVLGRRRLRRRVPGVLAVRDGGRRDVAVARRRHARAGARRPGREPGRAAPPTSSSRPGSTTRAARGARSPTCRRSPIRRPASPSMTRRAIRARRAGWCSAAPARRRRSSPACSRRPAAARRACRTRNTARAERRHVRLQRRLLGRVPVHAPAPGYDGPTGLGTPNGLGAF